MIGSIEFRMGSDRFVHIVIEYGILVQKSEPQTAFMFNACYPVKPYPHIIESSGCVGNVESDIRGRALD